MSQGPWSSMNLGRHVNDQVDHVLANRKILQNTLQTPVLFLNQVHGTEVLRVTADHPMDSSHEKVPTADAVWTDQAGVGLSIMVADCLPVLFAFKDASAVGAAHAGWRGLCHGVLEQTVQAMTQGMSRSASDLDVWLGPCIGPLSFEVGEEVRSAFMASEPESELAFQPSHQPNKWLADLPMLAIQRLRALGITSIHRNMSCTYLHADQFFSYRRDGVTGRMAAAIALIG